MAILRCFILACSLATATVAAHADDDCASGGCSRIAWPAYADIVATESDVEALLDAGDLSAAEADLVAALVVRRQALRIRGLELRYAVGKTATSEGEGTDKLGHIRHQIGSIEEEIGYIDRQLARMLHAHGQRSGPWIATLTKDACTQYWFVARSPCEPPHDISLPSATKPHWLEANAPIDAMPSIDLPGTCEPLYLGLRCPSANADEMLLLRLDGAILRFHHGHGNVGVRP